ncbi:MAG: MarP family serine protease [Actinomycetales bacterium]
MSPATAVDLLLVILLLGYAVVGYRQGLVTSLLSAAGFVGAGLAAIWLLPMVLSRAPAQPAPGWAIALVSVVAVFAVALLGQVLGGLLGRSLRARAGGGVRVVDSVLGIAAVVTVVALGVWLIAGVIRPVAPMNVAAAIGQSRVIGALDAVVPAGTAQVTGRLTRLLDDSGFPRVFEGTTPEPIVPVLPPDPQVNLTPGLVAARDSIVKVTGTAQECRQGQEGSGWVTRPGQVVTNAHVVAGVEQVQLQVGGTGPVHQGRVIYFDPTLDLAVISAPDLGAPALSTGEPLDSGDPAVVAGFPLDGPYHEASARVRGEITAMGSDIYDRPGSRREIYSLYGTVEPGNSGGPLLDVDGGVVGVIFARSLDDPSTAYALTLDAVTPGLVDAADNTVPVSTGSCSR